jgi:hypothetical protein
MALAQKRFVKVKGPAQTQEIYRSSTQKSQSSFNKQSQRITTIQVKMTIHLKISPTKLQAYHSLY